MTERNVLRAAIGVTGIVLVVIVAMLMSRSSSDDPTDYTASLMDSFVNGCVDGGGSEEMCQCYAEEIEANVPFGEFYEWNQTVQREAEDGVPEDDRTAAPDSVQEARSICDGRT